MLRTIASLSGWICVVSSVEERLPCALTTLSVLMTQAAVTAAIVAMPNQSVTLRAERGTGVAIRAEVGDWNSSTASASP